jgi:hypothetical protein
VSSFGSLSQLTNAEPTQIGPVKSAFVQVSETELDWLVGMSYGRFRGLIVAVTPKTRSMKRVVLSATIEN